MDKNIDDDLEKRLRTLKQDGVRSSESNRFKEDKLQEYVDFKIEDKFEKRYANLKKDPDLDYKYKVEDHSYDSGRKQHTNENSRSKELFKKHQDPDLDYKYKVEDHSYDTDRKGYSKHQKYPIEDDLDRRFQELKPEKSANKYDLNKFDTKPSQMTYNENFSLRNSSRNRDALYNIAEEANPKPSKFNEIRSFQDSDLRLDLSQQNNTSVSKKLPKVFEFDDEKELNKIYESFFNEDNPKKLPPAAVKSKTLNKINEDSFRQSYLSEMNTFNSNSLTESYRPTFK